MKNAMKVAVSVFFLATTVLVSQVSAVYVPPQTSGESSLQEILDTYFGSRVIDVASTPCQGELFMCTSPTGYMIEEIADFRDRNVLSWYNPLNVADRGVIFEGPYNAGAAEVPFSPSANPFGFLLTTPQEGVAYYSQLNKNFDQIDHFWVFLNPLYTSDEVGRKQYIIAVEDLAYGGDQDHNDMVFAISGITPVPAPEPGTLMLIGSGLIGLIGFIRRCTLS